MKSSAGVLVGVLAWLVATASAAYRQYGAPLDLDEANFALPYKLFSDLDKRAYSYPYGYPPVQTVTETETATPSPATSSTLSSSHSTGRPQFLLSQIFLTFASPHRQLS